MAAAYGEPTFSSIRYPKSLRSPAFAGRSKCRAGSRLPSLENRNKSAGGSLPYITAEEKPKPKRVGLTKAQDPENLTFEEALALLELPKRLGHHPETEKVVKVGVGMYGPYVLHDKTYGNFDKKTHTYEFEGQTYNVLNVTLEAAVDMLKNAKKRAAPTPIRELGKHPEDEEPIGIFEGRYGPYVKHKKLNATIPKDKDLEKITLEEALKLLEEKAAKKGAGKKKSAKKKTAKKKKKVSVGQAPACLLLKIETNRQAGACPTLLPRCQIIADTSFLAERTSLR